VGTGFLVVMPDKRSVYLVTADHVAKTLGDGGFYVRMNRADTGLAYPHLVETANWIRHPTTPHLVDIAVLKFEIPDWAKVNVYPRRGFLSDFKMGTKKIGPGDLAYVVGIFEPLHGRRRNIPAVHTGHISLIPEDEPLPVQDWNAPNPETAPPVEVEAYLVEAQNTLPGSSGGPVFVRRSLQTRLRDDSIDPNPTGIDAWMHGSLWLLGVWTDAWFGDPAKILRIPKGRDIKVPIGIGAVVPARKLIEILEQPQLMDKRATIKAMRDKARAPGKVSITQSMNRSGDDLLRNMMQMPPAPRSTPKGKTKRKKTA
jgi:Trypsin-like peptidase domain